MTLPLAFLSLLYGLGVRLRVKTWERRARQSLPGFVVSVGNITVGGTGKTPAAMMLAEWAMSEGYRVAVLSRGYGGRYRESVLEVSDGRDIKAGPAKAGDEPCLMAARLPGVPVVLAKERYLAGLHAHRRFNSNFFILDDGFQHLALKRDLDLVLIDAVRPFGNGRLLPRGPLREPIACLSRADAFLITGAAGGLDEVEGDTRRLLEGRFVGKPVFRSRHAPERVVFPNRKEAYDAAVLKGRRILAFAGIAGPERFRETLKGLGAEPLAFHSFGDHHRFTPGELRELIEQKNRLSADHLLTTEKDWVRLEERVEDSDLGYLTIRFDLGEDMSGLVHLIHERLDQKGHPKP